MPTRQIENNSKWEIKDVIKVLLGFAIINIFLLILTLIHKKTHVLDFLTTSNQAVNGILIYVLSAATFLLPLWFFTIRNQEITTGQAAGLNDFNIKRISVLQAIKTILIGYGVLIIFGAVLIIIKQYVGDLPGLSPQESMIPVFGEGRVAIITISIIAVGIAPMIEEIFFRGFLLNTLMSKCPFFIASTITSAIFAFVHFQFESMLAIFILSMIINYLYKINGNSTTATIIFHMANNLVAIILLTNLDKITFLQ
ncbi:MAG: type II CAAX endopeptidase family protein [Candidatus Peregrinibacteria bacterium]|nr:type II CAAX endopeptidase family protein [Candidatus Peregrinibacteria bacterium]MDZ4244741.1 type II CAAX endopeptidase family protein [Candidatus Gracilibacteria bacterium]